MSLRGEENVVDSRGVRFATYNISLYGKKSGEVAERLAGGNDRQAKDLASVIQIVRPDVLFLNEIDYDADGKTLDLFADQYLGVNGTDTMAIDYPHRLSIVSNTGLDSSLDLNVDGETGGPNDAWGYGVYPGQYAMALLSRYPMDRDGMRTFQRYLWSNFPEALRPIDPRTKRPYYSDEVWAKLRLSSKNHADIPVVIGTHRVHVLASHPTPPVFDGPEDRNGCRNHDEVRFWSEYLGAGGGNSIVDDRGKKGGLATDDLFVIVGDLNADVTRGDGRHEAIKQLLDEPRLMDANPLHVSAENETATDSQTLRLSTTAAFGGKDGMRVDYVLPSREMTVVNAGVFWPGANDPRRPVVSASDHRLVWVEVTLP